MIEPFFSVVVPAYNAEQFVGEALDSIAGQTLTNYEIVVVDDGSTDDTSVRVNEWRAVHPDINLKLLRQENRGIGGARNAGIREAIGQYIAFLDADDQWMDRKLEVVALHIGQFPVVELWCHDEWIENNGHQRRLWYGPYTDYRQLLFKGNCLSTSATIVRRAKLLEVAGFSENLQFNGVEDYELWLRLARAGCRIAYIHEPLGRYRVHGGGVTSRIEQHCEHCLNVLDSHFDSWYPKSIPYRYLMRKRRAATIRGAGRTFISAGRNREARPWLMWSLRLDPFSWKTWVLSVLNLFYIRV